MTPARPLARSIRALSASLLASTSILTAPVTVSAPLTAATLVASAWLGAMPAAAQFFPVGGDGGDSGGYTPGGFGGTGSGCGCVADPGVSDAAYGGGGGGGGAPGAAGAKGGDGENAGGAGGANPGDNGVAGNAGPASGAGGGGGAGGAVGANSFNNTVINGGAGGVGGAGGAGVYAGGGGGGGAGGYGVRFSGKATVVTNPSFGATGGVGGVGGAGGYGTAYGGQGGSGGGGGIGVSLGSAGINFTNSGAILGGNGGVGGAGGASANYGGDGGDGGSGGNGLLIDGGTITNNATGTIAGGNAGAGGAGGAGGIAGNAGLFGLAGGTGIYGYTGSTIINSGKISGGNSSAAGGFGGFGIFLPGGGSITNNVGGIIQGGAALGGGFSFGGPAIYANNATITNRGTIVGGSSGGLGSPLGAIYGSNLTVINSGTIVGSDGGIGPAITFYGGTNVLELQAGSVITGLVYGGCGCGSNSTLRFGGARFGGIGSSIPPLETFDLSSIGPSGQYIGFSSFQVAGGAWNFTGTAVQSEPWTVTNGVMFLSGDLSAASSLSLNNNSALIGAGGILGNTQINSGGIFAPGFVIPGTRQTILGTVGFTGGSQYVIFVDPSGASGADATGAATLTGGTVQATFLGGAYTAGLYNILTASSVTGKFSGGLFALNTPAGFFPSLNYSTPGEVNIEFSTTPPPVDGLGENPQNVVNAITNFSNNGGTVPSSIAGLFGLAGNAANHAFGQMAGQPGPASAQSGINSTNTFINTLFDNAFGGGAGGAGGSALGYAGEKQLSREVAEAYAAVTPRGRRQAPFTSRWNVWATGYGGYSQTDGSASDGTATTTSRVWGIVAGAEYQFTPDTKAGFAMGGSGSNFDLSEGFGSGSADAFNLAVYGRHQMGAAYVAGALGYSVQAADTRRVVTILGTDVLEADFTASVLTARLEGGYRFAMAPVNVAPYAALQSTTYFLPSYSEHATSGANTFALSYDSEAINATRTELGARFDKVIAAGEGIWTLRSKLAWAHDWNTDQHATATFQTLPGATFTVNGATPAADSALVSLGAEYAWGNGWSLAANFDGEFSGTTNSYAGKGTLRYEW